MTPCKDKERKAPETGALSSRQRAGALLLAFVLAVALFGTPQAAVSAVNPGDSIDGQAYAKLKLPARSMPDVTMKSGLLVTQSGQVLWSRDPGARRQIASITKIMTAILAIQTIDPDKNITVPQFTLGPGDSSAGLKPGEVMSRHELLQALLIPSGNDAAITLAVACKGNVDSFVTAMNAKAAELGMSNTHFVDPDGVLDTGPYSTATDIATMTRYAMTLPEFCTVVDTREVKIVTNIATHDYKTTNDLLLMYNGANGVKTGFTDAAGYSVATGAARKGIQLYAIVLGTNNLATRFTEAASLLDFGFTHYRTQTLALEGTILGRATVTDYLDRQVPVALSHETTANVNDLEGIVTRKIVIWDGKAPIKKGQQLGMAQFIQNNRLVATTPLVATEQVKKPFFLARIWYAVVKGWRAISR
ncbi:MAG: D-alanyl-D-alanine carboxypeptidase [Coriobacteriia bacterium]|nr:D-alanyl-D-alanine carboxypeptidase [Coriobacteriia bacterium]